MTKKRRTGLGPSNSQLLSAGLILVAVIFVLALVSWASKYPQLRSSLKTTVNTTNVCGAPVEVLKWIEAEASASMDVSIDGDVQSGDIPTADKHSYQKAVRDSALADCGMYLMSNAYAEAITALEEVSCPGGCMDSYMSDVEPIAGSFKQVLPSGSTTSYNWQRLQVHNTLEALSPYTAFELSATVQCKEQYKFKKYCESISADLAMPDTGESDDPSSTVTDNAGMPGADDVTSWEAGGTEDVETYDTEASFWNYFW